MSTQRHRKIPFHIWEARKEDIRRLYIDRNLTLPGIMKIMSRQHGFTARLV